MCTQREGIPTSTTYHDLIGTSFDEYKDDYHEHIRQTEVHGGRHLQAQ